MREAFGVSLVLGILAVSSISAESADIAAGKAKAAGCADCHGPAGISSNPIFPHLAGQHADYLAQQMINFKGGVRENPFCGPMVNHLTDKDIENVAAYYASLRKTENTKK